VPVFLDALPGSILQLKSKAGAQYKSAKTKKMMKHLVKKSKDARKLEYV